MCSLCKKGKAHAPDELDSTIVAKLQGDCSMSVTEAHKKLSVKNLKSCFSDVPLLQVSGELAGPSSNLKYEPSNCQKKLQQEC